MICSVRYHDFLSINLVVFLIAVKKCCSCDLFSTLLFFILPTIFVVERPGSITLVHINT